MHVCTWLTQQRAGAFKISWGLQVEGGASVTTDYV